MIVHFLMVASTKAVCAAFSQTKVISLGLPAIIAINSMYWLLIFFSLPLWFNKQ